MSLIQINGSDLSIEDVVAVARKGVEVCLTAEAEKVIQRSQNWVKDIMARGDPVYGINTGFGFFADKGIPCDDAARLSRNLILSHAVGTGPALDEEIVRAALLIRANTLAKGYSGVRLVVVETLLDLLNEHVTPIVPSQGSLGSSGDLCSLSHMALVFTTDSKDLENESGQALYEENIYSGKEAMEKVGLQRIKLGPKEGLALNNGATFSAAIAALALFDAELLLNVAEISLSMSLEALMGCSGAFDERIHQVRGHQGQIRVAEMVRKITKGSSLVDAAGRVQDAYSLRCAPQVQGIGWDSINFVGNMIEAEINASTDNPLLFGPGIALSGGNFHGEPVGVGMDFLGIAMAEIAAISERRTYRLLDEKLNANLPPMLVDSPEAAGLNSGLMMLQYVAASLVLENQTLASPDSVHSLPTSAEQEDHNANAMTASRHTRDIIMNTAHVLAIEVYTAARALDLRLRCDSNVNLGQGTKKAYKTIRDEVPYQAGDAWWGPEIEKTRELILGEFVQFVLKD